MLTVAVFKQIWQTPNTQGHDHTCELSKSGLSLAQSVPCNAGTCWPNSS